MVIYKITNKINGKVYIGQTVQSSTRRITNHKYYLRLGTHHNAHLQRAWNKYGQEHFTFTHIDTASSIEQLNEKEQYWIAFYRSATPEFGYNKDLGGLNNRMTPATKEKIRQRMLGTCYSKGKKQNLTEEQRLKRAENTRQYNLTRKFKLESKKKISESLKRYFSTNPPMVNNEKAVYCITNNTTYKSVSEAARQLNCDRSSVNKVCNGKSKHTKNLVFEFVRNNGN